MTDPTPLRRDLPTNVEKAARTISREVWGEPYSPGKGVMHYAGGSYWKTELWRRAAHWQALAAAARICADFLDGDPSCR